METKQDVESSPVSSSSSSNPPPSGSGSRSSSGSSSSSSSSSSYSASNIFIGEDIDIRKKIHENDTYESDGSSNSSSSSSSSSNTNNSNSNTNISGTSPIYGGDSKAELHSVAYVSNSSSSNRSSSSSSSISFSSSSSSSNTNDSNSNTNISGLSPIFDGDSKAELHSVALSNTEKDNSILSDNPSNTFLQDEDIDPSNMNMPLSQQTNKNNIEKDNNISTNSSKSNTSSFVDADADKYMNNEKYHYNVPSSESSAVKSALLGGEGPLMNSNDPEQTRRRTRTVSSISDEASKYQKMVKSVSRNGENSSPNFVTNSSPARVLQHQSYPEYFAERGNTNGSYSLNHQQYDHNHRNSQITTSSLTTDSYISTLKTDNNSEIYDDEAKRMSEQHTKKRDIVEEVESIKKALYSVSGVFDNEISSVNDKLKDKYHQLDVKIGECLRHLIDLKGKEILLKKTESVNYNDNNWGKDNNRDHKNVKTNNKVQNQMIRTKNHSNFHTKDLSGIVLKEILLTHYGMEKVL